MTTIFRKELKDVLRWTPLGVIVIGLLCWQKIPGQIHECSDVPSALATGVIIASGLFAVALGLLQSLFDLRPDARAFLLHRPIAARDIFRGKLAAGFVAHTLAWAIPLLLAAIYLESIGPERLPVTWSNVILPAMCCGVSFLFHPAGMWMACREARWLGTKCLPLVLPVIACVAALAFPEFRFLQRESAVPAVAIAVLAWIIVAASQHALTHQMFLPAPASEESSSWSNTIGLSTASTVATVTVGVFLGLLTMSQSSLSLKARRSATSADGQLWEIEETWKSPRAWDDSPVHRTGRSLTADRADNASFTELDATWQEQPVVALAISTQQIKGGFFGYRYRSSSASKENQGSISIYERNSKLYLYGQVKGLIGTVTPQGIFKPDETPQGAFSNLVTLDHFFYEGQHNFYRSLGGLRLLADDSGIYQLDVDAHQLRQLSDVPAQGMAITLPSDERPRALLWTRDEQTARRFSVRPLTENQTLPSIDSELVKATHSYPLANIELTPDGEWSLDWIERPDKTFLAVASVSDNGAVFIANDASPTWRYRFGQSDGSTTASGELPDIVNAAPNLPYEPFLLPPALITGSLVVAKMVDPDSYPTAQAPEAPDWWWLLVVLHAIIGGLGAFLLARSRVSAKQSQLIWMVIGVLVGVPAWLAAVAVYPRPVVESCTACQRRRRVDTDRCEHCHAEWDVPEMVGIELIGPRVFANATRQAPV